MVNMSRLFNKVAIVTGASKGIGGGIATALGAAGARVAVNYSSDREGAERVAQAITDNGGGAIAVGADVSKAADVARLFKEVDSAFGRLDVSSRGAAPLAIQWLSRSQASRISPFIDERLAWTTLPRAV